MPTNMTDVTVPLLDLKAQYATIRSEIEPAVQEVLETQVFIGGPKVAALESTNAAHADGREGDLPVARMAKL